MSLYAPGLASADQLALRELQHHLNVPDAEHLCLVQSGGLLQQYNRQVVDAARSVPACMQADPNGYSSAAVYVCCIIITPADSITPAVATAGMRESKQIADPSSLRLARLLRPS